MNDVGDGAGGPAVVGGGERLSGATLGNQPTGTDAPPAPSVGDDLDMWDAWSVLGDVGGRAGGGLRPSER
jgi:hypothetical protein